MDTFVTIHKNHNLNAVNLLASLNLPHTSSAGSRETCFICPISSLCVFLQGSSMLSNKSVVTAAGGNNKPAMIARVLQPDGTLTAVPQTAGKSCLSSKRVFKIVQFTL